MGLFSTGTLIGIVAHSEFRAEGVRYALQSGPRLVEAGGRSGIYRNDYDRQNRTAICFRDESLTAIIVEGGATLFELAEFLSTSEQRGGFGCDTAINLDGGPSTQALFREPKGPTKITGRWRTQNAIVIYRRSSR